MTIRPTLLCALSILAGVNAWGQSPPPIEVIQFESFKLVGSNRMILVRAAVVPATNGYAMPKTFTLTASQPGMVQQSRDGANWAAAGFCESNLVVTNLGGTMLFREQAGITLAWSNSTSPDITNYVITESTSHSGQGNQLFNAGNTNQLWVPLMDCGPCYFDCAAQDCRGNTSAMSNTYTNAAAVRPVLKIAPGNELPGTNAP